MDEEKVDANAWLDSKYGKFYTKHLGCTRKGCCLLQEEDSICWDSK